MNDARRVLAEALAEYRGKWVAVRGSKVIYSADSSVDVILHLRETGTVADSTFRVPVDPAREG